MNDYISLGQFLEIKYWRVRNFLKFVHIRFVFCLRFLLKKSFRILYSKGDQHHF